jgi:zinc transport system substrate-binding protein
MLPPGSDAETFEPSMSQLVALQSSDAYMAIGGLPFEDVAIAKIKDAYPGLKTPNTTQGISYLHHTHGPSATHSPDADADFDPHVWTSVANMKIIAANMLRTICTIDPAAQERYRSNYSRLITRLEALSDSLTTILAPARGACFMVHHPSLGYFARDYGLHQLAVERDGKEVSPSQLRQAIDQARTLKPKIFLYEASSAPTASSQLAADLKIPLRPMQLLAPDWDTQMLHIAHLIAQ